MNIPLKSRRQAEAQAAAFRRHQGQDQLLPDSKEYDTIIPMDIEAGEQETDTMTGQMDFKDKLDLRSIGDVFELSKCECGSRELSVLIYIVLRHFAHIWRNIDALLHNIGGNQCKIAYKWAEAVLTGDFDAFEDDGRGGRHNDGFYGPFLELEIEAGFCNRILL